MPAGDGRPRPSPACQAERPISLMSIHPIINNTEEGQALVEYALILTLVSLAAVAALGLVGTQIQTLLNSIASYL